MNYSIKHDGDCYFYPTTSNWLGTKELKFPTIPYERDYHNENTRREETNISNFKLIQVCPRFRLKDRLISIIDRFLIADKICHNSNLPIQAVLYCRPNWPSPSASEDCGKVYSGSKYHPKRLLWHSHGNWEVNFVWSSLPKEWQYNSGNFNNRFETFEDAITSISNYIGRPMNCMNI